MLMTEDRLMRAQFALSILVEIRIRQIFDNNLMYITTMAKHFNNSQVEII